MCSKDENRHVGITLVYLNQQINAAHPGHIQVTGIYFDYLSTLLHHAPKAVAYKTLVKESQGYDTTIAEARELARWRIHELRKVVEVDAQQPEYILTVRGTGYRLVI